MIQKGTGTIYFKSEPVSSFEEADMEIKECTDLSDLKPEREIPLSVFTSPEPITCEIKFEDRGSRIKFFYQLLGRKGITNNWLKMHGGVLMRKGLKKRKRVSRRKHRCH